MIRLDVLIQEMYNEKEEVFIPQRTVSIQLEHSLVSISKWESKWCKSFLSTSGKTAEETLDYIRCMIITQNVPSDIVNSFTESQFLEIDKYINADMTATRFSKTEKSKNREVITSELIYYWMVSLNIPFECQKWHLNRLLTLINVCNVKNSPPKKMNKNEIAKRNRDLNAQRKKAMGIEG